MPPGGAPSTILTEVDVSDPAAMRIVRTLTLDANYVSARLVGLGGASSSSRRLRRTCRSCTPRPESVATSPRAKRRNRAVIRASTLDNWLPVYRVHERGNRQDDDEVAARVPLRFVTPPSSPGSACSAS